MPCADSTDSDFEVYRTALEQYHLARELFWKRASTLFAVQAILFATLSLTDTYPFVGILVGLFGISISIFMHVVMQASEAAVRGRREVVFLLEERLALPYPLLGMSVDYPVDLVSWLPPPFDEPGLDPELYLPFVLLVLWIGATAYFTAVSLAVV